MATARLATLACVGLAALLSLSTACSTYMKRTPAPAAIADAGIVSAPVPLPPVAAKKPHQVVSPNGSREDEYYWLRDDKRENAEMLAYVKAENAYADRVLEHIKPL